jgi:hypothetical protein
MKKPTTAPTIFEWYENHIEEGLAKLYRVDVAQREKIVAIIRELDDSTMFWSLMTKWEDATEIAKREKDEPAEHEALMALLARVYIAGTLRGFQAVDL